MKHIMGKGKQKRTKQEIILANNYQSHWTPPLRARCSACKKCSN